MSISIVMVLVILMCIGMIGLAVWYINSGYSYKHTIDQTPEEKSQQEEQK
ncbi:YtzI protein [Ammoniphilus sp. CFH 90114]|nr:YtzI protein [Ammoniphilus sp. CFH 90114]RXT05231.1 YtzI protein [Ammoniphilus sp. CFH 90114]